MVTKKIIRMLRDKYKHAKIILHLWDSVSNVKGIKNKIDLFDYASSFDRFDCEKIEKLNFRPLFYTDDFKNKELSNYSYDLCFCGTVHSDRYYVIKELEKQCSMDNLKFYKFMFLQGKFIYKYYKYKLKGFKISNINEFSFDKKSSKEISEIESKSKVILDIQHPKQTGLTMRTIEMVGMNKKFITTNSDIINYDFYNKNNILVIDRNHPVIDKDFFNNEYVHVPNDIYEMYSLKNWILDVLNVNQIHSSGKKSFFVLENNDYEK